MICLELAIIKVRILMETAASHENKKHDICAPGIGRVSGVNFQPFLLKIVLNLCIVTT